MAREYGFSSDDADDDEDEDKQHAHMIDGAGSTAQAHATSHSDALWWSRCRTLMMISTGCHHSGLVDLKMLITVITIVGDDSR